jgi:hypothetical protein
MASLSTQAQCTNKISVSSKVNNTNQEGIISVDIKSSTNYTCTLYAETATGDTLIDKKKGRGRKLIEFDNLEKGVLYSVRVVFSGEKEFLCNKLSKTVILK